jgi:Transposase DDE domain
MDFTSLFVDVDDFCQAFLPRWHRHLLQSRARQRNRQPRLAFSEIMTILIGFHASHFRTFKHYYLMLLQQHQHDFPGLVSYSRFVELMPSTLTPLGLYLQCRFGSTCGIAFVDSTPLAVCHPKRINRHHVFRAVAALGKSSKGWFLGFKLHLIINEQGELLGVQVTAGNVDDRVPVPQMAQRLWGKLFGDKGYISAALFKQLWETGVQLVTSIRRNMRNRLLPLWDKLMLRKRCLIETVNDQLKNIAQVEHTRHRSVCNFLVNLLAGLISYTHQPQKPTITLSSQERNLLQLHNNPLLLIT